ncbi:MAG: hypothetical protein QOF09_3262 [Alphaproteobacteria bacterium]|nr:hypothetical protein [Alphaproteobacteria bacterium]
MTACGYGFRARRYAAPRNDEECDIFSTTGKSPILAFRRHVKPQKKKYSAFHNTQINGISDLSRPAEGTLRGRHGTLGRDAMDAVASGGLAAGRKRCSVRRSRVVLAPRPWRLFCGRYPANNGDNKRRSPGRARISRKAIARGKPGCLGCTCQTRAFFYPLHTVLRAQSAPGFPCALCGSEGQRDGKTRAKQAARTRTYAPSLTPEAQAKVTASMGVPSPGGLPCKPGTPMMWALAAAEFVPK